MKKLNLVIISALICGILYTSCDSKETNIIVNLKSQENYGPFMPAQIIVWPSEDSLIYANVPTEIDDYVVRKFTLQHELSFWYLYLNNEMPKEAMEKVMTVYKLDSTKLSRSIIDSDVLVLVGVKGDKRIVMIDSNNDKDFGDEKIFEFEYPLSIDKQKEIEKSLPIISTRFEYFENNQVIDKYVNIRLSPYQGDLEVNTSWYSEKEKKYFLSFCVSEHKKGEINLNGVDFDIFVSNGFIRADYDKEIENEISIFLTSKSPSLPLESKIPYKMGEIFNADGKDYSIDSISKWGDQLFISYVGENIKPKGVSDGYYLPEFNARYLDNTVFDLKKHSGKYILLDFWGTWCNPCIRFIPELKKLNEEFSNKNFVLISVAHDDNVNNVIDFVDKNNMDWEHLFVNSKQNDENSVIEKLKVKKYPTTILISPDTKIVGRDLEIDVLRKFLVEKLNDR